MPAPVSFAALHRMPVAALRGLAAALESGLLSGGITRSGVAQAAGVDATEVAATLRDLGAAGLTPPQMSLIVRGIAEARGTVAKPSDLYDLVLSGPDLPGVPMSDTAAVMHTLVTHAEREILLVGYAVYDGRRLFDPLARRMEERPELAVTLCLDIARPYGNDEPAAAIVSRFALDFRSRHWPWPTLPELWYDPRSLETGEARASLHAKCVVVDRSEALVTSANFTAAAQRRNIELGVSIRYSPTVERLADYFAGLQHRGILARCPLS